MGTVVDHLRPPCAVTIRRAFRDRAAAEWLYDRAIDCWYGWGSLATRGGDGAARLPPSRRR